MNPLNIRRIFLIVMDILLINLSFIVAFFIHFEGAFPWSYIEGFYLLVGIITLAKISINAYFQLYNSMWSYASIEELIKVVSAVFLGNVFGISVMLLGGLKLYFGVYFFVFVLEVTFIGGFRFVYRVLRRVSKRQSIVRQDYDSRILIIGTGSTATLIATEIKNHPDVHGVLVGFIDDDPTKYNTKIAGTKILGNRFDIVSISKRLHVNEIILAIPTVSKEDVKRILDECKRTEARVRILPGVREIMDGKVSMNRIREVEIEDLLGRDPVDLNVSEIAGYIESRRVMVTGGGGSIGSELCRQIVRFEPKELIILDVNEKNAYLIQKELLKDNRDLELKVIIASVRDRSNIFRIIERERPQVIFHAAAHKHVPLMERSPKEAVKNNSFGTMNVAEAAAEYEVERFVLISTDKAVNPTNVMGTSKRMCEMVIQGLSANHTKTKFAAVRFGNVLGSNGSVIPLFKNQIKDGGPVTVTHKDIIRYFMTIPEAAQLVIQAGSIAKGGEIFVLDMGEPVRIYDLAIDLIRLSGLKPFEDIDVEVVGLRPGEKLFEELLMEEEGLSHTNYNKIHVGAPSHIEYKKVKDEFKVVNQVIENGNDEDLVRLLKKIVPTFKDNTEVNSEENLMSEGMSKYKIIE